MTDVRQALVVGASRGLGLGLAAELKSRRWNVFATVRDQAGEHRLQALAAKSGGEISVEHVDVNDDAAVAALRRRLDGQCSISSSSTPGSRPNRTTRCTPAARRRLMCS